MLFLLDVQLHPIIKCPSDDICFWARTLHVLALGKLGPECVEVLKLDEVPDLGEWGRDN